MENVRDVYVGDIPVTVTEVDVRNVFEQFGPVKSVKLLNTKSLGGGYQTDKLVKYGFVSFKESGDAETAIQHGKVSPIIVQGQPVKINWSIKPNSSPASGLWSPKADSSPSVRRIPGGAPLQPDPPFLGVSLGRGKKSKLKSYNEDLNNKLKALDKEETDAKVKLLKSRINLLENDLKQVRDEKDVHETLNLDENLAVIAVIRTRLHQRRNEPTTHKNSKTVERLEKELTEVVRLLKQRNTTETFQSVQKKVSLVKDFERVANDEKDPEMKEIQSRVKKSAAEELIVPLSKFLSSIPYCEFAVTTRRLDSYLEDLKVKCPSLKDTGKIEVELDSPGQPFEPFDLNQLAASIDTKKADDLYDQLCQAISQVMGFLTSPWGEQCQIPEVADLSFQVKEALQEELNQRTETKISRLEASHVSQLFGKLTWCHYFIKELMSEYAFAYKIASKMDTEYNLCITVGLFDPDSPVELVDDDEPVSISVSLDQPYDVFTLGPQDDDEEKGDAFLLDNTDDEEEDDQLL